MKLLSSLIKSCAVTAAMLIGLTACVMAEPPMLSKSDATKIIQGMGYTNVVIAFIVTNPQGLEVHAIGTKNGSMQSLDQHLQYDNDLGWFYSEPLLQYRVFIGYRIWNINGYSDIKPPPKQ